MEIGHVLTFGGILIAAVVATWTIALSVFSKQIEFAEKQAAHHEKTCHNAEAEITKLREKLRNMYKVQDVILQKLKEMSRNVELVNVKFDPLVDNVKQTKKAFDEFDEQLHALGNQMLEHFKE